jgi:hypothetical protein
VSANEIRAMWLARASAGLPPEIEVGEHCRGIVAKYARFYQEHPDIYPWAGAAAFAVHQVGVALLLYEFEVFEGQVTNVAKDYKYPHGREVLFNDLNHMRKSANAFFAEIAWALEAYPAPDGGLAAIEAGTEGDPLYDPLRRAFRLIDQGRPLLASPSTLARGQELIWEASIQIEYFAQAGVLQKFFASMDPKFDLFMTTFTLMNFEPYSFGFKLWKVTFFDLYMWTAGLPRVIRTMALPNLGRLDHRWSWVTRRVFPIWKKVMARDPDLLRNIAALITAGELTRQRRTNDAGS